MGRGTALSCSGFRGAANYPLFLLWQVPSPPALSALGPQGAERLLLWHSGGSPGPSLCSEAPQEGFGTPFHGGHRGCSGPGSAPCSNSISCKFSSGSPLAQACLLPLGQRGERPGPSVLTSGNPCWGRVSGQRPSSEPLTPFPSPAVPVAWAGIAGRTSGEGNSGPSFSPGAARAASLLFSQEAVHSAVPGQGNTACHTSVGGLKVTGNVAGIRSGAPSSPSPSRGCQVWAYPLLLSLFGVPGDKAET